MAATLIRGATPDDADRILALTAQAFNMSPRDQERRRDRIKFDQITVGDLGNGVVATARAIPFGHWFGGRLVPAAGISAVAVGAEARGRGLGRALMAEVLRAQRDAGVPISSLYPATVPIYRSLGYGYGGIRTVWKLGLDHLPPDAGPGLEVYDDGAIGELNELYLRLARATNGMVERTPEWWTDILRADGDEVKYRYLYREDGAVTGWINYSLTKTKDDWRSTLQCRDLFWSTPGAGRALLSLGSLHRSTSAAMTWVGPVSEPLGDLTREDVIQNDSAFRYMIRLVDVAAAFEARGYPAGVEADLTIAVEDPLFDENAGPWQIRVSAGAAKVVPASDARARADVQTWASIWSGLRDPRSAVRTGALVADEAAITALEQMFAGPTPWIADFY